MTLEVMERHVYHIANRELADQVRQANATGDLERLDELITFLNIDGSQSSDVLGVREITPELDVTVLAALGTRPGKR
jgi:hypothetical protein